MLFSRIDYTKLSDNSLIERYRRKEDGRAIEQLFGRYYKKLLGTCLFYLKDKEDSRDAVSNIILELLQKLKSSDTIKDFKQYQFIVARNYCYKQLKKRADTKSQDANNLFYHLFVENQGGDTLQYLVEESEEEKDWIDPLYQLLDELNEEQRYCLELHYLQGWSYRKIEEITGYSQNKVKSYIQNGKRQLRNKLPKRI